MRPLGEDKEGRVRGGGDEAELTKEGRESLVPSSRGLLQSVQGLLQEADVICSGGVDETWWLLAVDRLVEVAVKAFFTSSWWIGQAWETAMLRTVRMVACLTTGLKVSS
jgi:hypothetical protein